ncbi:Asr1405/Asl0597 family protein [Kamptonema formosum]|uniref:Asr1405/Asl0597 family protein n=1 Tax=Kamptonema formosum TaxID=331992 RepID=UPI00034AD110|nr:Asr1405/Asl0597 family protein [Oscillatoria sp. PCC 10802]
MQTPPNPDGSAGQIVKVKRSDRWLIYYRLQELMIPCWCPADGSLRVEVNDCVAALLVRSTVQQFVASRQELVDWLERCWHARIS